jgi:hypothetical protein
MGAGVSRTLSVKLARTLAGLADNEENQSVHLAEALHASQPSQVNNVELRQVSRKKIRCSFTLSVLSQICGETGHKTLYCPIPYYYRVPHNLPNLIVGFQPANQCEKLSY